MSDVRSLPVSFNGKLIYQLISAAALKDNDLIPVSTADRLTRNVSMSQIKSFVNRGLYSSGDVDALLDQLMLEIKNIGDQIFDLDNDNTEFRNEFNVKLNKLNETLSQTINNLDKKLLDIIAEVDSRLDKKIDNNYTIIDNRITEVNQTLSQKIYDLDKKLEGWILYGTTVPTSLPTGRVYMQYF